MTTTPAATPLVGKPGGRRPPCPVCGHGVTGYGTLNDVRYCAVGKNSCLERTVKAWRAGRPLPEQLRRR